MDARKRGKPHSGYANGGHKKPKGEVDSTTGVGSKTKPCTKFFSISGCPFGGGCHFLHYVPGGCNVVAQMMNLGPTANPPPRSMVIPQPQQSIVQNGSSAKPTVKNRICSKYNTAEGCKFGDKCHYAHGEWELGKPVVPSHNNGPPSIVPMGSVPVTTRMGLSGPSAPVASFGASATAKISVDAALAGLIIGKGGMHSKQIYRQTGAKLSIKDHETDPALKSIELEGTFDQIKQASAMVTELIQKLGATASAALRATQTVSGGGGGRQHPGSNFKTKLCDNFNKGSCTFGGRCHFAHGAAELRKSSV